MSRRVPKFESREEEAAFWDRTSITDIDPADIEEVLGCEDCGRPYHCGPDLVVPNDVWRAISPTGDEGGTLCPNCMHDRLAAKRFATGSVPAQFTSGPMAAPETAAEVIQRQRAEKAEAHLAILEARIEEETDE